MVSANVLKNYIFFKGFTDAQLKKMASIAFEESYQAGTQLYKKGDPARSFFICKEGKVVMVMDNNMGPHQPPLQITVDIITKGESMGWSSVVDPYLYTLGALCIDHTKLIAFDAAKLRNLMDRDCELGYKVMQATAKVISLRLAHTRIILVGERGLSHLTDY
jgi:CRP-like cAMP-binding protein